jgi:hypothetical protein
MREQDRRLLSPREIAARLAAERAGRPFLVLRDGDDEQQILGLPEEGRVTIGRHEANDVCLEWDTKVSRVHAELECLADAWTVLDDGISRNGSSVNGTRLQGRRRLYDGDQLRFGSTTVTFRQPAGGDRGTTEVVSESEPPILSPAQKRVLVSLCRPFADGSAYASPATNREIAGDLHLSVDAVKTHLRAIGEKLGADELPQNVKRRWLVERALELGLVTRRDLSRE